MGGSTVLAFPPPSGTPTPISAYYGTVVIATSWDSTGTNVLTNLYIFSTAGPFYIEQVNLAVYNPVAEKPIDLYFVYYDGAFSNGNTEPGLGYYARCTEITSPPYFTSGDITSVAPTRLTDPSGTTAVAAATEVEFSMVYVGCPVGQADFPSGMVLTFEATVLAPTAATVSICANEGITPLFSCKS
jgi:hypothetical protein